MDYARCTTDPCAPRTRDLQAPRCDYPANVNAHGHGINVVSSKSAATSIACNNVPFKNRMYKNGGIAAPFSYATPTRYLSRSLQRVTGNLYGSAMAAADRVGRRKLANEPLRVRRG